MKFLIMGCGSIGQRHISNLKSISGNFSIDVFDSDIKIVKEVAKKKHVNIVDRTAITSEKYDCVFVCTPPHNHTDIAIKAISSGSNVFVEKPLSDKLSQATKLRNLIIKKKLLGFVGYNLRFNKGINIIKKLISEKNFGNVLYASAYFGQYLPDWRPNQDYKKGYTANKKLGGGIILDDSHEIDYLVWLLRKPSSISSDYVFANFLATDTEAISDVILKFPNKILGHIHMDYVRRQYKRALELVCEKGLIQWSLSDYQINLYNATTKKHSKMKLIDNINDMYVKEMEHVVYCLKQNKRSKIIDIDNGLYTLKLSDAIKKSGLQGKRIIL